MQAAADRHRVRDRCLERAVLADIDTDGLRPLAAGADALCHRVCSGTVLVSDPMTRAPLTAKASAVARPIPDAPRLTMALWPANLDITRLPLFARCAY